MRTLLLLAAVALIAGCSGDSNSADPPDTGAMDMNAVDMASDTGSDADMVALESGRLGDDTFSVEWSAAPAFTLRYGTDQRLSLSQDAIQLGVVQAVEPTRNYDPWGFYAPGSLPPEPQIDGFISPVSARVVAKDDTSLTMVLQYERDISVELKATVGAPGRFDFQLTPTAGAQQIAFFRINAGIGNLEGLYGLGEVFDDVNHRGHVRAMQLEVQPGIESSNNEAHVPIPLLIGTNGWGLFVNSFHPGVFDVATTSDDQVSTTWGLAQDAAEGLDFYLMAAEHPLDITKHYHDLTGKPVIPARWALGPWIWRDENDDQAQVESDLNTIRDLDLATTGYWIDRPYATGVNTFDFSADMFTDPQSMIDLAHDLGFRMALWHTPYLDTGDASTQTLRDEANTGGYYPPIAGPKLNGWGPLLDLTNPDAYSWWQANIKKYTDMGIEGFKLDYGEDIVLGVGSNRLVWEFANGRDERTMHNLFQHDYHKVYAEMLPETGGFLLCRRGTIGDQTRVSVIWPGDLDANMAKHGETVTDGDSSYVAVGGVPAALIAGLSLGPAGYPLYGSDTGGYRHSPPNKETFIRWFQVTALSPVMQVGTSANDVPWEFNDENGWDQETLDLYRQFARLHLRLFPYVWTYLQNLQDDGRPIQRALGLAYPEMNTHPNDVFMLGDHLLVAPVVEPGVRQRTIPLPPGEWVNWWTGERLSGPGTADELVPLDTLPLYISANGMVPMLRPTIDTTAPVADPQRVDSYANNPGRLHVRVPFGAQGSFQVFDGAMVSAFGQDEWQLTSQTGSEMTQGVEWEILSPDGVTEVLLDGQAMAEVTSLDGLDSGYLTDGVLLRVRVPGGAHNVVLR